MHTIKKIMKESVELVFFPAPGMGHLISAVELAKLLIKTEHHISITILIFKLPFDLRTDVYVQSQTADDDGSGTPRLRFVTIPVENSDSTSTSVSIISLDSSRARVKHCVEEMMSVGGKRIGGFVVDLFSTAMIDLADELSIPSYVFYTSGAAIYGFLLHLQNIKMEEVGETQNDINVPTYARPFPTKCVPSHLVHEDSFGMFIDISKRISATKGVMINTFLELQSYAIGALLDDPKSPPVYPIGPVLNVEGKQCENGDEEIIINWLDDHKDGSVVFLCFGSEGFFPKEQVKEIAIALERSGHTFLWTLTQPPETGSLLPREYENLDQVLQEGFLQRTQGVGKVIRWAPQVAVLRHPAVGGFVSHCGWNSILESIWFGKPIAAWPIYAEQQANAFEIVEEIGIGVEIKIDYKRDFKDATKFSTIVSAEEIENGIKSLMDPLNPIRLKAKEMSEKSKLAIKEGGSSFNFIRRFIDDVYTNIN